MTKKLYDLDAYQTTFDAHVISCTPCEKGYDILLDQTLFFPEEGGQTCDQGVLEDVEVFDVQIKNGIIHHYTKTPLEGDVHGEIVFSHRYMNMQNHSGEHVLSGLVHSLFGLDNVGFHLGKDEITADYNGILTSEQVEQLEKLANEKIYENHVITCSYPDNVETMEYRSKKVLNEAIRIVDVEGIDVCACCAPHVRSTIEIGVLKVLKAIKFRKGTRIYFVCGQRAILDYQNKHKEAEKISVLLKANINETYNAVNRMYTENISLKQQLTSFKKDRIQTLCQNIETKNFHIAYDSNLDAPTQKYYVSKLMEASNHFACVFNFVNDEYRFLLVSNLDARIVLQKMKEVFEIKGGGKKDAVQGSLKATQDQLEAFFEELGDAYGI